jgi:hypothetical protein
MVAMVLLVLGFMGAWAVLSATARMNALTGRVAEATTLAQDKIEDLLRTDFAAVGPGADAVDGYSRTWTATTNLSSDIKTLAVSVSWQNVDGIEQTVALTNVVCR